MRMAAASAAAAPAAAARRLDDCSSSAEQQIFELCAVQHREQVQLGPGLLTTCARRLLCRHGGRGATES